jgi:hypothetical protein
MLFGKRVLIEEEKVREDFAREFERLLLCEKVSRRQKSMALWLRKGDKSIKFFHKVANSNRRNNTVNSLFVSGSLPSNST